MSPAPPQATQSGSVAEVIYAGFRAYRGVFEQITAEAPARFASADWSAGQAADAQRLATYHTHVRAVRDALQDAPAQPQWELVKVEYNVRIANTNDPELAETFYNSVHRDYTQDKPVNAKEMYLYSESTKTSPPTNLVTRRHATKGDIVAGFKAALQNFAFPIAWQDLDRDVSNILRSLAEARTEITKTERLELEFATAPFFRNKGAYIIGKLHYGDRNWPIALPILHSAQGGLYVDTLICDENELSVMFSFTRAYFMVTAPHPSALVNFLHSLLPNKKISEIYAAIGLHKHGKTTFYRGFLQHLDESDDKFIIAPGIKGMVMSVFTLPSYQTVFKVIKDRFAPQKRVTATQVKERYQIVKTHDRVGRMADTQEFRNFSFPKARFTQALLNELRAVCASSIIEHGEQIIIRHLYTERHMTPLNMYIEQCSDEELDNALDEYGNAIKQLAAANIFPGDMLLKNFGITRHGRVVFYDYDEIAYLTDMDFRDLPEPDDPDYQTITEPWDADSPLCAYPARFRRFLHSKRDIELRFSELHGEIFTPQYWRELQRNIAAGEISDVFPYRRKKRFFRSIN